jgi:hypothetical protein
VIRRKPPLPFLEANDDHAGIGALVFFEQRPSEHGSRPPDPEAGRRHANYSDQVDFGARDHEVPARHRERGEVLH